MIRRMVLYSIVYAAVAWAFTGCNTLRKAIPGWNHDSPPSSNTSLPADYTVTGTTTADYQTVAPVRCTNSNIRVWVKRPGQPAFIELNAYEFQGYAQGTGAVVFGREVIVSKDQYGQNPLLIVTGNPAAPMGTEYKIESTLVEG